MKMSPREWMLGMLTVMATLYGLLYYGWTRQQPVLQQIRMEQAQLRASIAMSRELVDEREIWESRMAERQGLMPVFPQGQRMDLHWLAALENIANRNQLQILRHESGEERQEGPVFELPIYIRQWEGSIDALVRFLFDIEREGAMLDVRYLHVRPKDRTIRHGRIDVFCAYLRES
ncbi:MAG: hypothetical protein ACNA71_01410 [Kiritimatiellia bacterium]